MNIRLGVNIDHVATLRNARGGSHPDVLRAARICRDAGAESLTIHLREDRRHIRDADVKNIIEAKLLPVNLEMAATEEMVEIALKHRPHAVCIVPEKRQELTTEGGLDVASHQQKLTEIIHRLNSANIRTSLFIDPDIRQVQASAQTGANCVEIHTGTYAEHFLETDAALQAIQHAVQAAHKLGLEVHAGHGLNYDNVRDIAAIPHIRELNIGHFLVGEALFAGLAASITAMRRIIDGHTA